MGAARTFAAPCGNDLRICGTVPQIISLTVRAEAPREWSSAPTFLTMINVEKIGAKTRRPQTLRGIYGTVPQIICVAVTHWLYGMVPLFTNHCGMVPLFTNHCGTVPLWRLKREPRDCPQI